MTNSSPVALPDLRGTQTPRLRSVPPYASTTGDEAIKLAALAGIHLDPWQQLVLRESLGERLDGRWAAFEVAIVGPRQNGKNEILLARELAGLFLLKERLIIHSAHHFGTSSEHFLRLVSVIESTPSLSRHLEKNGIATANGKEGIKLKGGRRLLLKARQKGTGRGLTADCLIFDEAWELPETSHGAVLPTLATRPNAQIVYAATAVDQLVHENGVVLARLRERGIAGDDPALAYFEWSLDCDNPEHVSEAQAGDPETWAAANPALGIRIDGQSVVNEQRSLDSRSFAVERLGVGDWPRTDGYGVQVISEEAWAACEDHDSTFEGAPVIAFDVSPLRDRGAIGIAGTRTDGLIHIEVIEARRKTGWIPERLAELVSEHDAKTILCDGPAASLAGKVNELLNFEVTVMEARQYAQACEAFFDGVTEGTLRHMGSKDSTVELDNAVHGAATRPLKDSWAWSRREASVDITPLVACTLAHWGARTKSAPKPFMEVF